MVRQGNCPPWCAGHVAGPGGAEHRAIVGDVRLTLSGDSGARRVTYAVRRHAARTPVEMAKLAADLTAAGDLLRRDAREQVVLMDHRPGAASARLAPV